jgi:N-acetylmuramoyl-L-alanine amidase
LTQQQQNLNDGWLEVQRRESPNIGGVLVPEVIVIHATAGGSAASSVNWLTDRSSGVSAHMVIERDGGITQLVPFNRIAWHAGQSCWRGRSGVNRFGIGIELANWQAVSRTKEGHFLSYTRRALTVDCVQCGGSYHEAFPDPQVGACADVCACIMRHYQIAPVSDRLVRHSDISPGRKYDPGPAFGWVAFCDRVGKLLEDD